MARSTILPDDRDLSNEELVAEQAVVRQLLVLELERVLRHARDKGRESEQWSERGPDPRWDEIQVRAALGIARLMSVDRGLVVAQEQPGTKVPVDEAALRREVLGLLQASGVVSS